MAGGDNNRSGGRFNLPPNTGPRIGRIGAWGATPSSSSSASGGRRIATLGDVGSSSGAAPPPHAGHRHPHSDDDDEDDDDEERRGTDEGETWFAGGERSGISIQNPDSGRSAGGIPNMVRNLLQRAAQGGPPPNTEPSRSRGGAFTGGGHVLGGDEVETAYVPDPSAPPEGQEETAIRHLIFWRNGFSIENGAFMSYEDPANRQILAEIEAGRAPPHILNVNFGQPVEVRVDKRTNEDYVPPPAAPFSGSGHRLGAPAPGVVSHDADSSVPGSFPSAGTSAGGSSLPERRAGEAINTRFEVDQTKPTTSVQIRLADGTRMVARMNLTHTVGDIRSFINASRPENNQRAYTIGTTFPNRTLEDSNQTVEAAGLVNSVIVQRWVQ